MAYLRATFRVALPIPVVGETWDIVTDLAHAVAGVVLPGYNNAPGASDWEDIGIDITWMFRRYFVLTLVVAIIAIAWRPLNIGTAINQLLNPAPVGVINPPPPVIVPSISTPSATVTVSPTATQTATATVTSTPTVTLTPAMTPTLTETATPIATPMNNRGVAFDAAFESCASYHGAQKVDIERMKQLLSPFGEPEGFYDNNFTYKGCLFVDKDEGAVGTIYFVVASEKGFEMATIRYYRTP